MAPSSGQGSGAPQARIVLVVLLALSLACVTLYAREGEQGAIHSLQNTASGFFVPIKTASGVLSSTEQSIADRVVDATSDPNSIIALREQNEQLRSTVAQLEEFRQEAIRLEGLLEVRTTYDATGVPARVLSRSADAWNKVITIDAGSEEGVHAGLPAMGPSGLIGQVVSVAEHSSDVRLLNDAQSGVAVIIQSSREEGIVHGSLDGLLFLEDIGDDVSVEPGDVVLTSGLGGGYFRGILVGTILKVEGEAGATTRKIIVEPNEGSNNVLEEVYVVTSMTSKALDPPEDEEATNGIDMGLDLDGDGVPDAYTADPNTYGADSYAGYGAYVQQDSYGYADTFEGTQ